MLKKLKSKVQDQDQFAFMPESQLSFGTKSQFTTLPGGIVSVALGIIFTYAWY
jgi:hypothetical protein